jgi:hypothetical protein
VKSLKTILHFPKIYFPWDSLGFLPLHSSYFACHRFACIDLKLEEKVFQITDDSIVSFDSIIEFVRFVAYCWVLSSIYSGFADGVDVIRPVLIKFG